MEHTLTASLDSLVTVTSWDAFIGVISGTVVGVFAWWLRRAKWRAASILGGAGAAAFGALGALTMELHGWELVLGLVLLPGLFGNLHARALGKPHWQAFLVPYLEVWILVGAFALGPPPNGFEYFYALVAVFAFGLIVAIATNTRRWWHARSASSYASDTHPAP